MRMLSQYFNDFFNKLSSVPFDTLMLVVWCSFGAVFVLALVMCFMSAKIRAASKRPYLCLVNAYAAVTLAAFLTANELAQSLIAAALFWIVGYLTYGILCFLTRPVQTAPAAQIALASIPAAQPQPKAGNTVIRTDTPAAKSSVRLEHAISVTDKLLGKNLGKGDRQELEKLKNTLAVLQMKGTLSPAEADILNDNFNALLKLMAKYNV